MKRLKKILFNILALVMVIGVCFGATACGGDIKTIEVTLSIYSESDGKMVDKTLTVDLYGHLAPETVDHVIENCVDKNYYDNAIFYKADEANGVMMGDLKIATETSENEFDQILPLAPALNGIDQTEFNAGGTVGSDLKVNRGSIALYRTWTANNSYNTNADFGTGRATWLMPTAEISKYNDYLCVFAQIDLVEDEENIEIFDAIDLLFSDATYYDEFVVYYTGTYDATKTAEENFGLKYNCVAKDDFNLTEDEYFVAEGDQYVCYNKTNIKVPYVTISEVNTLAVYVKSVKLA